MKLKDFLRLAANPAALQRHLELRRVRKLPRFQPATVRHLMGAPFELVDGASFNFTYEEIIERETYRFVADGESPFIIDGGANIGLSVAYFKRAFPRSRIKAFEADRRIFEVLKRNVAALNLSGVELFNQALWSSAGRLDFVQEGADAGRIADAGDASANSAVEAVPLAPLLTEPVDLLKLDIEGAEFEVLHSCRAQLGQVKRAFVEYHSFADRPQCLPELLALLAEAGFRLNLTTPSVFRRHPFISSEAYNRMDMVVNIYAMRPAAGGTHTKSRQEGRA
jgi:FkbM family methyltransferase